MFSAVHPPASGFAAGVLREDSASYLSSNGYHNNIPDEWLVRLQQYISDNPGLEEVLRKLEPNSEVKRLAKLLECRFGGQLPDSTATTSPGLPEGRYWDCPVRDLCPAEGIACRKLYYNGAFLGAVEVKLMRMLATEAPAAKIAEEMLLPQGTFRLFKRNLYRKLGVKSRHGLRDIAKLLGLI